MSTVELVESLNVALSHSPLRVFHCVFCRDFHSVPLWLCPVGRVESISERATGFGNIITDVLTAVPLDAVSQIRVRPVVPPDSKQMTMLRFDRILCGVVPRNHPVVERVSQNDHFVCFHALNLPNPLGLSTDFRNFYFHNLSRFGTIIVWMVGTIPGPSTALSVLSCGCGFALGANTATARSDHSQIVFDLAHALNIS